MKFEETNQVEPTNNHVERVFNKAVPWGKRAFGLNWVGGCRLDEQALKVVRTLRLKHQIILQSMIDAPHINPGAALL